MTAEKSAQMHAAKERKRIGGEPPDCAELPDYSAPVESWTIRRYRDGMSYRMTLFPSRRRANSFRVVVNGKEWTRCMGYDRIMRQTVKALVR